ncbi:hypothetical protein R1sor_010449 [Riccia sorocarpa]|uniref:Reverse transcriptase zinc-binding domain-containing protein n=1 Tax=Riccia sorocarpa TaxID=122646 RepID=A0ABD3HY55_9MARC
MLFCFPEDRWEEDGSLHERLSQAMVSKMWTSPSSRQLYYLRDIGPLRPYGEKSYLTSSLPRATRVLIAQYRTSSHQLRVEVGRWKGLPREQRVCWFCTDAPVENEFHVLLKCPRSVDSTRRLALEELEPRS